jgi:hypothetical protein
MDVVDSFYAGLGDDLPRDRGLDQGRMQSQERRTCRAISHSWIG